MKRQFLLILVLLASSLCQAQKTYHIVPKWTVGETKTLRYYHTQKTIDNDSITKDTSYQWTASMKVTGETAEAYELTLKYRNIAFLSIVEAYDQFEEKLKHWSHINLVYSVNKSTGKPKLANGKDVKTFLENSSKQLRELVESQTDSLNNLLDYFLGSYKKIYETEGAIEAFAFDEFGYLLAPYGYRFSMGDTIVEKEIGENPLSPGDSVEQVNVFYLNKVNQSSRQLDIIGEQVVDMTEFTNMMKQMMGMFLEAIEDEEKRKKQQAEIDAITYAVKDKSKFEYNYASTWITKVTRQETTTMTGKGKVANIYSKTVVIVE